MPNLPHHRYNGTTPGPKPDPVAGPQKPSELHEITAPILKEVSGKDSKKPVNLLPEGVFDLNAIEEPESGSAKESYSFMNWKVWDDIGSGYDAVSDWTEKKFSRVGDLLSQASDATQETWDGIVFESQEVVQKVYTKAVELKDDAVAGVERLFSHIHQFSQGTRKEKQANCGPASAHIVGTNFGLDMPSLASIRRSVGGRTGNGRGAFAISTGQLMRAVTKQAQKEGRDIRASESNLGTNVDRAIERMKAALAEGKQVVLLTSNIKTGGRGHYVVVNKVLEDGSIEVSDPQSKNGAARVHSKAELRNAMRRRVNKFGRQNTLMVFEEK